MPIAPLPSEKLRRICTQDHFNFESTAELVTNGSIIGQPRGTRAIEFGIGIRSQGYNIFVLGETGTGRTTTIRSFLQDKVANKPTPSGWLYVHNFKAPHQPRAIEFVAGEGILFKRKMEELLHYLREDLPEAFDTEAYREAVGSLRSEFERGQEQRLQALQHEAAANGFTLLKTASGLNLAPVANGQVLKGEEIAKMPAEKQQKLEETARVLADKLETAFYEIRQMEAAVREQLEALNHQVAETTIEHHFKRLQEDYADDAEVVLYLEEIHQDVLAHLGDFLPDEEKPEITDTRRYEVNIFVDNSEIMGAPVVIEPNPTYANLIGRIEYEMHMGAMTTHFTNIKAGSLHKANGGYLVIDARDLLQHNNAWEALKRALKQQEIHLQSQGTLDGGNQVLAKTLDPEPIPLDVKVILMGSPRLYYALYDLDEDFAELFKVKADFDSMMPRDHEHEEEYARFIAGLCHAEGLVHFDRSAVAKIVEHGARLAEEQDKLSTRFGIVADMVRESSYYAGIRQAKTTTAQDVRTAYEEHRYRSNRAEMYTHEMFADNTMMISTDGWIVGQVNALSVLDMGDYSFGQPNRITAQTYLGETGVVNIEREVDMAGSLHNKGLLTLIGYLGGKYAQDQPLTLSASLAFEQNYGGIDGDSASSTELYALISSLSGKPIHQGRAVTGSVNQHGEIQPIGGVNHKIEGFFKLCKDRGLTGEQGVLIPASNVKDLMLDEDVIEAVEAGKFNVWGVSTIDEGIELLLEMPAGKLNENNEYPENSIHELVKNRLFNLATSLKHFGSDEEE